MKIQVLGRPHISLLSLELQKSWRLGQCRSHTCSFFRCWELPLQLDHRPSLHVLPGRTPLLASHTVDKAASPPQGVPAAETQEVI